MLAGLKVLEISCLHSMLAGQILADLGADVLVIEPPHGAPGRREGPFLQGRLGPDSSLAWQGLNRNKRGITLDLESPDGMEIFLQLAESADIVIESAPARFADRLGSNVLHCVLRPFSRNGPKSHYAFTDQILVASTGAPAYTGDADRRPLLIPVPQAMMETGAEAAIGILGALAARDEGHGGQRIDVSARVAAMMSAFALPYVVTANDKPPSRGVGRAPIKGVDIPSVFECRDGFVLLSITFGAFAGMTERMVKWLISCGSVPEELAAVNWMSYPEEVNQGRVSSEAIRLVIGGLTATAREFTKQQLGEIAQKQRFFAAPLMDMSDVASFDQYEARSFWVETPLPNGKVVKAPARFAQFSNFQITHRLPAPSLSEHTQDVLAEVGYAEQEIQALYHHAII
jgi:crotonobetainyl-CoA:carnitine CoA-transferase CaiB-like acyl-CoA transferase